MASILDVKPGPLRGPYTINQFSLSKLIDNKQILCLLSSGLRPVTLIYVSSVSRA